LAKAGLFGLRGTNPVYRECLALDPAGALPRTPPKVSTFGNL
jgi:hypothetical protein